MAKHIHIHVGPRKVRDAYQGEWTAEVEPDQFKGLAVGKVTSWKGVRAKVTSKRVTPAKKTENGMLVPEKYMVTFATADAASVAISPSLEKQIGMVGSTHREDMPANVFLEPASRKYPVKEKEDGEWKWSKKLLLAAAREARMQGDEVLAKRADEIRAREFGADI